MGIHNLFLSLGLLFVLLLHPLGTTASRKPSFNAIYQFGDSLSDTGNAIIENPAVCSSLPYGETFFGRPTGRCSDGLLVVDFIAKALGLPLLNPYLKKNADFVHGVNFAVAGATAVNTSVIAARNITIRSTNSSLSVQVDWFKTHLKSICSSKQECKHRLRKAVFLVGEIGGNDYAYSLGAGSPVKDLYKLVPGVIHVTKNAVKQVIDHGGAHVVVKGYFPIGCSPVAQLNFASNDTSVYDKFKCIKVANEFYEYHNLKLQDAVKELQTQHPSVTVSYGDTYSAFLWLLRNAVSLGFERDGVFKTCCGDGNNAYNYNASRGCGTPGVSACQDPKKRLSWDGLHLTQQAHKYLAGSLLAHNLSLRGN